MVRDGSALLLRPEKGRRTIPAPSARVHPATARANEAKRQDVPPRLAAPTNGPEGQSRTPNDPREVESTGESDDESSGPTDGAPSERSLPHRERRRKDENRKGRKKAPPPATPARHPSTPPRSATTSSSAHTPRTTRIFEPPSRMAGGGRGFGRATPPGATPPHAQATKPATSEKTAESDCRVSTPACNRTCESSRGSEPSATATA
jgi:hypothetical protein